MPAARLPALPTPPRAAFAAAAVALSACGGGGGGGGTTAAPPAAAEPTLQTAARAIVVLPAAPASPTPQPGAPAVDPTPAAESYAEDTPRKIAFERLNAERVRCGFGAVRQDAALDAASADTSGYFAARAAEGYAGASTYYHRQDPAKSGYTGAMPRDRAIYRGYPSAYAADYEQDVIAASKPNDPRSDAQIAAAQIAHLLTTVYHLGGMMAPIAEVGVDFRRVVSSDGWDMARTSIVGGNAQAGTASGVRTYPCEGTEHVNASFRPAREAPNPAPDLYERIVGTPIYVVAPAGETLAIASAAVTASDDNRPAMLRVITAETDVHAASATPQVARHQAYLLPLYPLKRGVRHLVEIAGTRDGVPFSVRFGFTPTND